MTDTPAANNAPTKPATAQDHYADFIGRQARRNSIFDTRDTKPVSADDIGTSTGKIDKK